mgnify:FL=1
MRTELEFSLRFVFDPTKPVKAEELAMLDKCVALVRQMKGVTPQAITDGHLTALEGMRERACENALVGTPEERREKKRELALRAMSETGGNKKAAAEMLGIGRPCLYYWLNGYRKEVRRER